MAAALVVLGVVAGAALGLAFARGGEKVSVKGPAVWHGDFKTVSWSTTGSATIERTASGDVVLRLSRDFRTQRAPELFIHIGSTRMPLKRAWGAQTYSLSGNVDPHDSVQVFCEKCNKAWGVAKLKAVSHRLA
jgi:hypothetical protein